MRQKSLLAVSFPSFNPPALCMKAFLIVHEQTKPLRRFYTHGGFTNLTYFNHELFWLFRTWRCFLPTQVLHEPSPAAQNFSLSYPTPGNPATTLRLVPNSMLGEVDMKSWLDVWAGGRRRVHRIYHQKVC